MLVCMACVKCNSNDVYAPTSFFKDLHKRQNPRQSQTAACRTNFLLQLLLSYSSFLQRSTVSRVPKSVVGGFKSLRRLSNTLFLKLAIDPYKNRPHSVIIEYSFSQTWLFLFKVTLTNLYYFCCKNDIAHVSFPCFAVTSVPCLLRPMSVSADYLPCSRLSDWVEKTQKWKVCEKLAVSSLFFMFTLS